VDQSRFQRAREIWSKFVEGRDLSAQAGKTAGIDPESGNVWIGDSIQNVIVIVMPRGAMHRCSSCG
jgi:hypothetical protein